MVDMNLGPEAIRVRRLAHEAKIGVLEIQIANERTRIKALQNICKHPDEEEGFCSDCGYSY